MTMRLLRTVEFFLQEVAANLRRNGLMTLAAVVIVTLSLTVLGTFFLLMLNLQTLAQQEASKVEVNAFLRSNLTEETISALQADIASLSGVVAVRYVSPTEGLQQLQAELGLEFLSELAAEENPLPGKFEIKTASSDQVPQVAAQVADLEGIEEVTYGGEIVVRLNRLVHALRAVGLTALVLLGLATCGIIHNAIRLTIVARHREIRIMQLVGATRWFIRTPFLLEGLFHGLTGAVLACILLLAGYRQAVSVAATVLPWLKLVHPETLMPAFSLALLAVGGVFGAAGSIISLNRFLRLE